MILLTGGAGYIGSHVCAELLNAGYEAVIADDFSNSEPDVINRLERITGKRPELCKIDVCDKPALRELFIRYDINAVIHLAGKKAVGESVSLPLAYYRNNIDATITLLEVMDEFKVKALVFSSSATVYDSTSPAPYAEDFKIGSTNPYGWTKVFSERIMEDFTKANPDFCAVALRYFNPVGAHESGLIGEEPKGVPNNLMPYITKVATGELEMLHVFGNDYETPDGSGVRDYLHVCDLAQGHLCAVNYALNNKGFIPVNLGCGKGISVLELVSEFEKANNVKIPYVIDPRRPGDIAVSCAKVDLAKELFGWQTTRGAAEMCRDAYNYTLKRKEGFK